MNNLFEVKQAIRNFNRGLAELDLTLEELEVVRRHAKSIIASIEVRKDMLKQKERERNAQNQEEGIVKLIKEGSEEEENGRDSGMEGT